jgi:hypothetical protein
MNLPIHHAEDRGPVAAVTLVVLAVCMLGPPAAYGNVIVNGNFENTAGWGNPGDDHDTQPFGWRDETSAGARKNAAGQQGGVHAIGGSGTSAFMPADLGAAGSDRRDLVQDFNGTLGSDWALSFQFAAEDPGGASDRSLTGSLYRENLLVVVTYRVVDADEDGDGDFELYDGSAWQPVAGLKDSVIFDPDVQTSPLVHEITFQADWSAPTAAGRALTIQILDSSSTLHTASALTLYHNPPSQGNELDGMAFNTFTSAGDYLLDNVTVIPEPASFMLLALGWLALSLRRRSLRERQ